jgi:outer membrane protein
MKLRIFFISLYFVSSLSLLANSQMDKPAKWDLKTCIEYARKNNIQVQKTRITSEKNSITLRQSKEALFPSVSANSSFSFSNSKIKKDSTQRYVNSSSFGSSYDIDASMTLFNGLKNYNTIRQNELQKKSSDLSTKETENSIEISITQAYLEILYAHETLEMAKRTVETSKAQVSLSQNRLNAGSIAIADFSQIQAQYSSDQYSEVTAQNDYDTQKLTLKQLLELGITDELNIVFPDIKDSDVLAPLPSKIDVYQTALTIMPQIQNSELSIHLAEYDLKNAKGGYYPTLSLNTKLSTSHDGGVNETFSNQMYHNFNQYIGLSLSIPIYSNGSNKASVQKAILSIQSARLDYTSAQKDLLKTVESLYQDVVSMQSKYNSAKEQLKYAEESYNLTKEQYKLGMKQTVDLLTQEDKYLEAEQTLLQAKYGSVLNQKLLNFYQNIPIEL